MNINAYVSGWVIKDYHTESAGTAIDEEIMPQSGKRLALIGLSYTGDTTVHQISVMYAGGTRTTVDTAGISGDSLLVCVDAPKDPAGNVVANNDIIAYQLTSGVWEFNIIASLSTKTITLTNMLGGAVASGNPIRIFGVVGDNALFAIKSDASAQLKLYDGIYALAPYKGDPLYVSVDNATVAGSIDNMVFALINK